MVWYYKDGDEEIGPVSKAELQQLVKSKKVGAATLVRNVEMDRWQPLSEMVRGKSGSKSSQSPPPAPPNEETPASTPDAEAPQTAVCSQCGRSFPQDEVLAYEDSFICAECKPLFVQKLREGAALPTDENFAGFWIRFGAKIIDSLIIGVLYLFIVVPVYMFLLMNIQKNTENVNFGIFFAVFSLVIAAVILFHAAYTIWFVGRFGATLGKMACGLRVVLPGGGKVSYLRATGRFFGEWVTQLTFYIGYIIAAFDNEKRALHDHICGTRVIRK